MIILYDKMIEMGVCSKRRPDFLFDANTHFVIIEVDEEQHRNRECENARMVEIWGALGLPTIFIRYNPDMFTDIDNNKCDITRSIREDLLIKWLNKCMDMKLVPKDGIQVVYLFYDGFDRTKCNLEKIDILI